MAETMKVKVTASIFLEVYVRKSKADALNSVVKLIEKDPIGFFDNNYIGDNLAIESIEELLL